ncbi:hypothetical protein [Microviridae sp.]|nr:hypothetical protein [Microviridae sp.]
MLLDMLQLGLGFMADRSQKKMHQQNLQQSQAQFNAQMDQSVQRRVADAKAAGIHPLFAMGASVGASPTITAGQAPRMGNAQRAAASFAESLGMREMNAAAAARDLAEAQLLNSERARLDQAQAATGRDLVEQNTVEPGRIRPGTGLYDIYRPEIPESKAPGVRAGPIPENIQIKDKSGRNMEVLNPDAGLDEIAQVDYVVQKARMALADQMETNTLMDNVLKQDAEIARLEREWHRLRQNRTGRESQGLHWVAKKIASRLYQLAKEYRNR